VQRFRRGACASPWLATNDGAKIAEENLLATMTTTTLKAFNVKAGTTEEFTLKKQ
jgi:hypothetical protein